MAKKKPQKSEATGGGGGTSESGLSPAKEARLLGRAMRWQITDAQKRAAVKALQKIAKNKDVRAAARAIQVLATLEAQNQADQHKAHHYERLDTGKATERVAMEPVILREAIEPPKEKK